MGYFKDSMKKTYSKHGDLVVSKNLQAVANALDNLKRIDYPADAWANLPDEPLPIAEKYQGHAMQFVEQVQGPMVMLRGDEIPVSHLPIGGVTDRKSVV